MTQKVKTLGIDPVCLFHGIKWSEHETGRCLYCCLCFRVLMPEECHLPPDGTREDVCDACAEAELAVRNSREAK